MQRFVDEIVALPDREIFEAMIWIMERCKLVVEGAAAAPVAALLHGLVKLPTGLARRRRAVGRQRESRSVARAELELSCVAAVPARLLPQVCHEANPSRSCARSLIESPAVARRRG